MQAFQSGDAATARAFLAGVGDPTQHALLLFLIEHPDERFDGASLVSHLGLREHREVALATYGLGQALAERGFARPWQESQAGYLMPAAAAGLFRA